MRFNYSVTKALLESAFTAYIFACCLKSSIYIISVPEFGDCILLESNDFRLASHIDEIEPSPDPIVHRARLAMCASFSTWQSYGLAAPHHTWRSTTRLLRPHALRCPHSPLTTPPLPTCSAPHTLRSHALRSHALRSHALRSPRAPLPTRSLASWLLRRGHSLYLNSVCSVLAPLYQTHLLWWTYNFYLNNS